MTTNIEKYLLIRADDMGLSECINQACMNVLKSGKWLFVDHPGLQTEFMKGLYHKGYETVLEDRWGVTNTWTDPDVLQTIDDEGIKLISYRDIKEGKV